MGLGFEYSTLGTIKTNQTMIVKFVKDCRSLQAPSPKTKLQNPKDRTPKRHPQTASHAAIATLCRFQNISKRAARKRCLLVHATTPSTSGCKLLRPWGAKVCSKCMAELEGRKVEYGEFRSCYHSKITNHALNPPRRAKAPGPRRKDERAGMFDGSGPHVVMTQPEPCRTS